MHGDRYQYRTGQRESERMENTYAKGVKTREKIMAAIIAYIEEHQYVPSFDEIGEMVGLRSKSTVHHHIRVLIEQGRLENDTKDYILTRAIRVPGYKFVKEDDCNGSRV